METYTLKVLNAVRDNEEDIWAYDEGSERRMEEFP
jgi:hypothetical protein